MEWKFNKQFFSMSEACDIVIASLPGGTFLIEIEDKEGTWVIHVTKEN